MLGKFFKPKWMHKDATVRIQAISTLAGDSVEIIRLAQTDTDRSVRSAAVTRLTHLPTLVQLGHSADNIAEQARQRVLVLAASDHRHDALLADVCHWLTNPALLRSLARDHERHVRLRRHAIEQLDEQELLFNIANEDSSKEIQFLAAQRIHDLDKLRELDKQHGKNNKRLRQLLKERTEHEQQRQQHQATLENLCAEAESLGKHSTWEQDKTRARVLQQHWGKLPITPTPEQQQRFQQAVESFQQALNTYETGQAEIRTAQEREAAERARQQAEAEQQAAATQQAEREQREREQQAEASERERRKQQQAQQQEILQQLRTDLQTLDGHLEAEQYGEAIDLHQALGQRLKELSGIPAKELAFCRNRLQALAPYIRELQDWRRWGTDQARKQLIETAENLRSDDGLDPQERARKVQGLRDEWRKLSHMEPGQQRALWKTFDSTVTAAYEPSKQHFDAQAQQRQANLEQRHALCAELEALYAATDWENIQDSEAWRALQNQTNALRKRWKAIGTVNHKEWKPVNERFNAAMDAFETHFKAERSRNWQEREQLVTQAKALLETPDTAQAIADVKALQAEWQITLASRPSDEQGLWKQFREPIDALFARSREERDQKRTERDAQQAAERQAQEAQHQREVERHQQQQAELESLAAQSALNKQAEADSETRQQNQTKGESLCMHLEILLELETPAEFQQARMEYQIAQMRDAMRSRKATANPKAQALPLLKQWYALGGMDSAAAESQTSRIGKIRQAL
jgi:hypothetical protein